jgi:hypothetical protein
MYQATAFQQLAKEIFHPDQDDERVNEKHSEQYHCKCHCSPLFLCNFLLCVADLASHMANTLQMYIYEAQTPELKQFKV